MMISRIAGAPHLAPKLSKHDRARDSKPRRCLSVRAAASPINVDIKKEESKVVDTVLTSSVEKQVKPCLCGRLRLTL